MRSSALASALDVTEGTLVHGMPYLALGAGRPLVFLRWFTPDHANPTGWMRQSEIKTLAPLAAHFRVYAVNRAPGMAEGTTMADIAAEHADALRAEFGTPVDVLGVSSGGSLALQLAADRPAAVRRLIIASSGYTLENATRAAQLAYGEAAYAGRRALHHMAAVGSTSPIAQRIAAAGMWLVDPFARPKNPADTLAFIRAEDAFDLAGRLGDITAPTLVLGSDRDGAYSTETFRRTADGIPDSHLIIYPETTHIGVVKRFVPDVVAFLAD
ncbi:alpha/beta fold hydrolase [Nocardia sp. CA-120079]|uniref:alpha/beta fold hydrolase n=1 Tax=Nocardia sp. CA-120079 TaxID=3239974 RepID=UPI003D98CAC1